MTCGKGNFHAERGDQELLINTVSPFQLENQGLLSCQLHTLSLCLPTRPTSYVIHCRRSSGDFFLEPCTATQKLRTVSLPNELSIASSLADAADSRSIGVGRFAVGSAKARVDAILQLSIHPRIDKHINDGYRDRAVWLSVRDFRNGCLSAGSVLDERADTVSLFPASAYYIRFGTRRTYLLSFTR